MIHPATTGDPTGIRGRTVQESPFLRAHVAHGHSAIPANRDIGLLDAAAARPQSSAFGAEAYPSTELKAAALLHSIVRNHALVDGNERLGWLATVVFLDLDGQPVELEDDGAFGLVIDVAEGGVGQFRTALHVDPRLGRRRSRYRLVLRRASK